VSVLVLLWALGLFLGVFRSRSWFRVLVFQEHGERRNTVWGSELSHEQDKEEFYVGYLIDLASST